MYLTCVILIVKGQRSFPHVYDV